MIDLMEDQNAVFQLIAEAADDFHHVGGVIDVRFVGGLVRDKLGVWAVAMASHCWRWRGSSSMNRSEGLQLHVGDGLVDDALILLVQMAAW